MDKTQNLTKFQHAILLMVSSIPALTILVFYLFTLRPTVSPDYNPEYLDALYSLLVDLLHAMFIGSLLSIPVFGFLVFYFWRRAEDGRLLLPSIAVFWFGWSFILILGQLALAD